MTDEQLLCWVAFLLLWWFEIRDSRHWWCVIREQDRRLNELLKQTTRGGSK